MIKNWLRGILDTVRRFSSAMWGLVHGFGFRYDWRLYGAPLIKPAGRGSSISIGKRFSAVSKPRNNTFGIAHRVSIRTSWRDASITIGDDVGVSGCAISAMKSIKIGNRVLIGAGALIADNDSHPIDPISRSVGGLCKCAPVVVEDDVFIGARAIILKGVTIGRGSTIGAGAVVVKDVPPFVVVAGNPAEIVKRLVQCE